MVKTFPNLYYDSIKPLEIHVYHGSSFNPDEKWVVKGYEGIYGYYPSREVAIKSAIEIEKGFLFSNRIYVHSFGSNHPDRFVIKRKTNGQV